jgi:hypothetical protein
MTLLSDIQICIIWHQPIHSNLLRTDTLFASQSFLATHEIIWLILIYCIKWPISKGQGNELPFAGYLTL